jgi:hypothetical protein
VSCNLSGVCKLVVLLRSKQSKRYQTFQSSLVCLQFAYSFHRGHRRATAGTMKAYRIGNANMFDRAYLADWLEGPVSWPPTTPVPFPLISLFSMSTHAPSGPAALIATSNPIIRIPWKTMAHRPSDRKPKALGPSIFAAVVEVAGWFQPVPIQIPPPVFR